MAPGRIVTHGRVVEYTLSEADDVAPEAVGQRRAAMIVRVWSPEPNGNGSANLLVFLDGPNDHPAAPPIEDAPASSSLAEVVESLAFDGISCGPLCWVTSRTYDPNGTPGTWRWPTRV